MEEWKGRVSLITGASSGIGAGIAIEFAKNGCAVSLVGRNESNLIETKKKCIEQGLTEDKVLCIVADLLKDEEVRTIVPKTIDKLGQLNVVVNNAGIAHANSLETLKFSEFDDIMQTNLRAAVLISQAALPYLTLTKGSIINISSLVTIIPTPDLLAYSMAKAAMDQFTKCSALDLAPKGVRVNSINPGLMATNIARSNGMSKEDVAKDNAKCHPRGRLATVEEIANAAIFLASDKSAFTTGQTLAIEGGLRVSAYKK